nr:RNA viral polymerase - Hantavirus [Orthohantavirus]AAB22507.1 RNA viral polymerase [Hantavirus sp.=Hantaan virus, strain 76-118, Peptide, 1951 aa] [Orthohantavirus]
MDKYREIHNKLKEFSPGTLTAVECIDYLDRLYAVRHDIVDQMIKHDWSDNKDSEEAIGKVLLFAGVPSNIITALEKKIIPNHPTGKSLKAFFKMTPDNYKISGTTIEFVEVTVTADVDKGIREKKLKYEAGLTYIEQELHKFFLKGEIPQPYKITFNVVAVRTDGSNITTQWPSRRNDGVVQYMRLVQAEISYVREHLIKTEERAALEAMFNLKFNISTHKSQPYYIPDYKGMEPIGANIEDLVDYSKDWLSRARNFSFFEVKGTAVFECFNSNEANHCQRYPMSRKPRNFLLIQCSLITSYKPATTLSDQIDSRRACSYILNLIPDTPASYLIHDMAYRYINLTREDMINYYAPRIQFKQTQNVREPGTFKLTSSMLRAESKAMLDLLNNHKSGEKHGAQIESLNIASHIVQSESVSLITKILSDLELNITEPSTQEYSTTKHTYVDTVLDKFFQNETQKYLIDVLKKTTAWHIGHLIRDITESLIAHSGLKRSKYWSLHSYNNGNVILFILPSKSLEVAGSFIRFITVFRIGPGLVDKDNLDTILIDGDSQWGVSKVMSIDLNRLLALNIAFEKALIATATWFQYYTEDQGQFPLQYAIRSVFANHFLLAICQKMKLCAIFDNLRYLIPAVTSLYSGFPSLIEKLFERPFKSSLEVYIYYNIKSLLVALAQNNKARFYSKVKLLGLTVDQSTVGASGVYPSFMSRIVYKHYRSLISEVTTCFFLFEKGLHGNMNEEAKIHLETVEWALKFREKEEKYGESLVENGYMMWELRANAELAEQQLYCQDAIELAAIELNKVLATKSSVVANSILSKNWEEPYFSQTRNISLKGMSGQVQEDGHLSSSVTIIEAIRYLSNSRHNPSLLKLYEETREQKAMARIVRKYQRTEADRGFFITTLPTRCRLEIIEDYYDAIAKNISEEYISYGGEKKILAIQGALEKALRWASGESFIELSNHKFIRMKRKLMYVSADATKWSPGDNSAKFRRFTSMLHNGLPNNKLKNCVIDALKQVYKTDFFMSRKLRNYIDSMESLDPHIKQFLDFFPDGHHGEVKGNWLQGNLNKCSSLFGVAMSLLFKQVWTNLFPELDCFFEFAHHSDDALFIYGYLEPVDDGTDWFLFVSQQIQAGHLHWFSVNTEMWKSMFNLHEHILLLGSIKISPKKTTVSPTNAEFLSTFFEGCAVSIPFVKILLGSLSDLPGLGYFDDLAAAQSRCVKALDLGASPQVAQLAVALCTSKVERLYGTAPGMVNHPAAYLQVKHTDTPIPLGGNGAMSIMELATAGIGMSDKNLLKRALLGYSHKRQKSMLYILGLFKFLMKLSDETFQHERLGQFSFIGKVQWKIFTPKSEFEFADMYTSKFLELWSSQHVTYDYIIPKGRDNLLIYLVRKLNDPSIVTAMTMQSPLQLRFRMQAKQHMKVCRLDGEWVTFREVLAAANSFAENYSATSQDMDLFQTLTSCTFSKEYAWKDFLNGIHCDVIPTKQVQRAKVARTFTVREKLQLQANRRAYSGKQYDAYCVQTYNEVTKLYEGDLRVTFNFGLDCARLEIFWDKKAYILETSITQKHVLKIMMDEVSKELIKCGMRFNTEQVQGVRHMVLFKTESGFEWGKPNIPCIVYKNCVLRTSLRTTQAINHKFMITIKDDGLRAIAQHDEDSPRFLLAHAFHTIRDIRYQAVDAVSNVWFIHKGVKLYLNPIISSGLLENFMKNLPAAIPPAAYSLIMNRAKISVDLFMFNDLLKLINPRNTLDLSGLETTGDEFSTVSSMSSRLWSEEMSLVDDDEELDDEFTIDLQDVDFENIDIEADIEHFLQDESSYTGDLLISTEETESKKMRGIVKILEPVRLIKSWVSRGLSIEKVYSPVNIILMSRYISKTFNLSTKQVSLLDPYDLTELESIVRGWGECVIDQFESLDREAQNMVVNKGICPEDVIPDSLFSFRHTMVLLRRLFPQDSISSFY